VRSRAQLIAPSHALLAPSLDLHFDDIPGGIAAIDAVPAAGWFQIIALVGAHELTIAKQVRIRAASPPAAVLPVSLPVQPARRDPFTAGAATPNEWEGGASVAALWQPRLQGAAL
jgi:hypothetical protein